MTSPHLLVAQAVAAALRSAGLVAEAASWHEVVLPATVGDAELYGDDRLVVALIDGFESPRAVDDLARLVGGGRVRVVAVTSEAAAVSLGSLLSSEKVEVVTKAVSVADLVDVITMVLAGHSVMEAQARSGLLAAWVEAVGRQQRVVALVSSLTPQQRRILGLLASGHRVAEVAGIIGVTRGTVRSHVKSLRAKLGVRTQLEAVAMLREMHAVSERIDHHDDEVDGERGLVPRPRASVGEGSATRR